MSQLPYPRAEQPIGADPERGASFVRRVRGPGTAVRRAWRRAYVRRLLLADAGCAVVAAAVGLLTHTGTLRAEPTAASLALASALPALWVFAMLVARSSEELFLWEGPEEFRRVLFGAAFLTASVGTLSWILQLDVARDLVLLALPLATALTLAARLGQRRWVQRQRGRGRFLQTTLLVGHRTGVAALHDQLTRDSTAGYKVIGCCLPSAVAAGRVFDGVPVLGGLEDVAAVVHQYEVDTVAVLPSRALDGVALRRLGWDLEKTSADLLLAPGVLEIAGPRVRIRPVCGLSLLQMERPELRGLRGGVKRAFDIAGALLALVLLAPVLVGVAVAVKASSQGPVLFRQERVGRDGRTFAMLKFRTMDVGADLLLEQLAAHSDGNGVLFKMIRDPRVTRLGRVLRRYSIDELPQLANVLRGEMSLVGPRPPLPAEVAQYDVDMHRRFLVKPGMTGLWQVSGRSNLSWQDSVRIDLQYVEHWSLFLDLMIIIRTFRAVTRGEGAC